MVYCQKAISLVLQTRSVVGLIFANQRKLLSSHHRGNHRKRLGICVEHHGVPLNSSFSLTSTSPCLVGHSLKLIDIISFVQHFIFLHFYVQNYTRVTGTVVQEPTKEDPLSMIREVPLSRTQPLKMSSVPIFRFTGPGSKFAQALKHERNQPRLFGRCTTYCPTQIFGMGMAGNPKNQTT